MSAEVVVSYSRKDWKKVQPIVKRLQDAGVSVWLDQADIGAASRWRQEIVNAISECKVLILIASRSSVASDNVEKELSLASEKKKHILPILLDSVEIPAAMQYQLIGLNHVEVFRGNLDTSLQRVLSSLSALGVSVEGQLTKEPASRVVAERSWVGRRSLIAAGVILLVASAIILGLMLRRGDSAGSFAAEYRKTRPAGEGNASPADDRYELQTTSIDTSGSETSQLGLTIWRLRASVSSDAGPRLLIQEGPVDTGQSTSNKQVELIPERAASNSMFHFGERVFITLESPATGYLYVLDREDYSDGSRSEPYLIFPTVRSRGGNNSVTAGRLINIPESEDRPNYFLLKPLRPDQVGESLTIVVTARPVSGLLIGDRPLKLSKEQAARLESAENGQVERYEMKAGVGRTWTEQEKDAGGNGARLLTQQDPMPQTLFRVAAKPGAPVVVPLKLRYTSGGSSN